MTAKRFRLDTGCFIDMQENKVLTDRQATNLLNKLTEEKEELQEQITGLNKEKEQLIQCYNKNLNELDSIVDENEQLKDIIDQLRTDNTKQKKLLNTTMKENEHIKQTIKDMINTERTELGKMTLRHLWRQIQ